MTRRSPWQVVALFALAGVLGTTAAMRAQNATTGTLGGIVRDAQQGVVPGTSVVATHAPTGTRYEALTRGDGRFDLLNVQVGPYELEVALSGFGTQSLSGVVVTLGEATEIPITLQLATVSETVEVTAAASALFSPSRSGTTAGVESGVIETLPTLARSLRERAAARRRTLRRAPERLLGRRHQRHHAERSEPLQRDRLPLQPQRGAGRPRHRRPADRDLLRPPAGSERGRTARPEPRLLLRQRRHRTARDTGRLLRRRVDGRRLRLPRRGPANRGGGARAVRLRHPGRLRRAHPREPERQDLRSDRHQPVGRAAPLGAPQLRRRHRRRRVAVELPLPLRRQLLTSSAAAPIRPSPSSTAPSATPSTSRA